jgi:hypothetical protein
MIEMPTRSIAAALEVPARTGPVPPPVQVKPAEDLDAHSGSQMHTNALPAMISVPLSAPASERHAPSWRGRLPVLATAGALLALGTAFAFTRATAHYAAAPAAQPEASGDRASGDRSSAEAVASTAVERPTSIPVPPSAPSATMAVDTVPQAGPVKLGGRRRVVPAITTTPVRSAATTTAAPTTDDCSPPYTIDAKGVKRFKPQCF